MVIGRKEEETQEVKCYCLNFPLLEKTLRSGSEKQKHSDSLGKLQVEGGLLLIFQGRNFEASPI